MKKVKTINDRPMIAMLSYTTRWDVEKDQLTGEYYLTKPNSDKKKVNLKEETRTTGEFKAFAGRWGYDPITREGKVMNSYEYWRHPEPADFSSVDEILKLLTKKQISINMTSQVCIKRTTHTYINSRTLETTKDLKVAKSWFPGEKPLWINSVARQQVGVWIDKKEDHIEVSFWYNNEISKTCVEKWQQAKDTGFWLYPDGTISHFYKGKVFGNRVFEEKRMNYRSLDHRFTELMVSQYNLIDLRSDDVSERTAAQYLLCPETLKMLKDLGFPARYWTWGDNAHCEIKRTYDLINFIHYKQQSQISKKAQPIHDLLSKTEFNINDQDSLVQTFKNGLLLRVPGILVTYKDADGLISPETWQLRNPKVHSIDIIESYRIWIKNNGKETSCSQLVHGGKDWVSCAQKDVRYETSVPYMREEWWPKHYQEKFQNLWDACRAAQSNIFHKVKEQLSVLQYYKDALVFRDMRDIFNFLACVQKAPRLIDTLIKTGHTDLVEKRGYYYESGLSFHLNGVLEIFGLNLSEYTEKKGQRLWKNLGVSKEQFYFGLKNQAAAEEIFTNLRRTKINQPVKVGISMYNPKKDYAKGDVVQFHGKMYRRNDLAKLPDVEFTTEKPSAAYWDVVIYPLDVNGSTILENIPMKYIQMFSDIIEHSDGRMYDIMRILDREEITLTDCETIAKRKLNFSVLFDYLNMLGQISYYTNAPVSAGWARLPKDQATLQKYHDEVRIRLELAREEYYAEQQRLRQEEEATRTVKYKKLLGKLKDFAMEDDKFTVLIPQTLSEIVDEGANMHHCVGSYTTSVANGETFVFFLREKTNVNQCFVTFNICPADYRSRAGRRNSANTTHKWLMDQAFAAYDHKPSKEAIRFIQQWCEKNDVEFSTILKNCI